MGLLDDAIREHLELKRRRGADAGEISRLEDEALGPVRRSAEGVPDLSDTFLPEDDDAVAGEAPSPPPWEDERIAPHRPLAEPAAYEPPPIAAPSAQEPPLAPEPPPPAREPWMTEPDPEPAAEAGPEPEPSSEPGGLLSRLRGGRRSAARPESERDPEPPPLPAAAAPPHEPAAPPVEHEPDIVPADDEPDGEELLGETPEFLEETPEHDRLWFEQRPPRDFDFDD
jgi:hypothetical protein